MIEPRAIALFVGVKGDTSPSSKALDNILHIFTRRENPIRRSIRPTVISKFIGSPLAKAVAPWPVTLAYLISVH